MARKKRSDQVEEAIPAAPVPPSALSKQAVNVGKSQTKSSSNSGEGTQPKNPKGQDKSHPGSYVSRTGGPDASGKLSASDIQANRRVASKPQKSPENHISATNGVQSSSKEEPEPVDMSGMSASQKKNLKKKMRKQEQKNQEDENNINLGVMSTNIFSQRLLKFEQRWRQHIGQLENHVSTVASGAATKTFYESIAAINKEMQDVYDEEVKQLKKPVNKRLSVAQVLEQIKDVEMTLQKQQKELQRLLTTQKGGASEVKSNEEWEAQSKVEESQRYLAHLREQLVLTQQQSDANKFMDSIKELKERLDFVIKRQQKNMMQSSGNDTDGRKPQQKEAQWKRRLEELSQSGLNFVIVPCDLPTNATNVLFNSQGQPSIVLRKVERKFSVLLDKTTGINRLTLNIIGYNSNAVHNCYAFLNACQFPVSFESASNFISMENVKVGQFVGAGGGNIRQLETEFDVILWLEDKWLGVFGMEDAVSKAVAHIKVILAPSPSTSSRAQILVPYPAAVVRAMAQGGLTVKGKLHDVEKATETSVNVRALGRGDSAPSASVVIQGVSEEVCQKAAAMIAKTFVSFVEKVVTCDKIKASKLMRGARPNFYPNSLDSELVSVLRCDGGLLLVGPSAAVTEAAAQADAALQQLNRVTLNVDVKVSDLRLLNRTKRTEIETLTGTMCRAPFIQEDMATLSFSGTDVAVQKAVELVHQFVEEMGGEDELILPIEVTMELLAEKGRRLRDMETKHQVKANLFRGRGALSIRGPKEGSEAMKLDIKALEEELTATGKVTKHVEIPKDTTSLVIGRGGANVKRLQNECHLDWVHVEDKLSMVMIRGTEENVELGAAMIEKLVKGNENGVGAERKHEGETVAVEEAVERRPAREPRGGSSARGRGSARGGRGGAAVSGQRHNAPQQKPWNMAGVDENVFPSLGACAYKSGKPHQKAEPSRAAAATPASPRPAEVFASIQEE